MPRYLSLHLVPADFVRRDQLELLAQYGQRDAVVKGVRSFINLQQGKLACVVDAENEAVVREYYERIGFPLDSIMHVEFEEVSGSVFAMPGEEEST